MKKSILLGVVATVMLVSVAAAVIFYNFGFRQRFEVVSAAKIQVFLDSGLTMELQQGQILYWDPITDTTPKSETLYVKNVGTVDVTLSFNYDRNQLPWDWSLSWDSEGTLLTQGSSVAVTITLTLPPSISAGTPECNTNIVAIPVP